MATPGMESYNSSAKMYAVLNGMPEKCPNGNLPVFNSYTHGFREFCGSGLSCSCLAEHRVETLTSIHRELTEEEKLARVRKAKETCIIKYGVSTASGLPETVAKRRKTCLAKYGAEHQLKSPEYRAKYEAMMTERHGYAFPLCSPKNQEKTVKTTIERYGKLMTHARASLNEKYNGLNPFQVPEIMEKARLTMLKRTGVHHPSQQHYTPEQYALLQNFDLIVESFAGKTVTQISAETGLHRGNVHRLIKKHNLLHIIDQTVDSSLEWKIKELLETFGVEYEVSNRTILRPREINFVTMENTVGIEVGSLFWHSDDNAGRGRDYHCSKWQESFEKGLTLFQWFDDDIEHKWDQIVHTLAKAHGRYEYSLHPDDVSFKEISEDDGCAFVDANSFISRPFAQSKFIGVEFDNELYVVFEYAIDGDSIHILRVGEAPGNYYSLIYREFLAYITSLHPNLSVYAYTDNCTNSGHEWKMAGLSRLTVEDPQCKYTDNYHYRFEWVPEVNIVGVDEWESLKLAGYDRVWNAGQTVWRL